MVRDYSWPGVLAGTKWDQVATVGSLDWGWISVQDLGQVFAS